MKLKCKVGDWPKFTNGIAGKAGPLGWLPLSCSCPADQIDFLQVIVKKQDKQGEQNVRELQPHKLLRRRFATNVIKGNCKAVALLLVFIHCLGAALSPSDLQTRTINSSLYHH